MPPRLGWIILAVALLVPALMFWDWWTKLDSGQAVASRRPTSAAVFPGTPVARLLANPLDLKGDAPAPVPQDAGSAPALEPRADPDPTPSPMELERPPAPAAKAPKPARSKRKPLPTIQSLVRLQGITAGRDSVVAIVNERVVVPGGVVRVLRGGRPAAVKVVDIQSDRVLFQHGGRRWLGTIGR
ncbi:MAG: hypothetical protein HY554_14650 [Elusimicrobia bacterium]|nr:hypothetical protein [Elusimicrobiota bacterium]